MRIPSIVLTDALCALASLVRAEERAETRAARITVKETLQ